MNRIPLLVAALLLAPPLAEAAGVIRGTVWSTRTEVKHAEAARARADSARANTRGLFDYHGTPALEIRRPARVRPSTHPIPDTSPSRDISDVVVSVRKIPDRVEKRIAGRKHARREASPTSLSVEHSIYQPRVLVVAAGTRVEIRNDDRLWHKVFSVTKGGRRELGAIRPGSARAVPTDRPGTLHLLCAIHSTELAYVVVTPNHAFARPDSLGRFELPALPPGRYELALWDARRGSRQRPLEVPASRDVVCNLSF